MDIVQLIYLFRIYVARELVARPGLTLEIHFIEPRASPACAINSCVCSTRNGHVKSFQRESDTQYLLHMDLYVGGVWVKG